MSVVRTIASAARIRRLRTYRQFAEDEIVLSTGPYRDLRFKASRQPWSSLWLDAIDSGRWRRFMLTGPSQAGKTLMGSVLPVMYWLFERQETVIYAAPTLDMAADKWKQDVFPIIQSSRYRDLLPDSGRGSKGGTANAIQFKHGPTLRFMTGGGNDKVRAGFTARVAIITETDGMDEAGGSSREADKISQIEARTNAHGDDGMVFMECTVSTEEGRTWRELKSGTDSRIALRCPHCEDWGTPEREHLVGWQEARSAQEARDGASLVCPRCGVPWSEEDRIAANMKSMLIHKGQSVEGGSVIGMMPRTQTLAMRFTAANNMLVPMARVAEEEWSSPRTTDADLAEKKMRQFYWALPSEPEAVTLSEVDVAAICARTVNVPRGRVPADAQRVTLGVDVGKWLCHWVALAWRSNGTPHVLDYGRLEVPSQAMAEEHAILNALRRFRDEICAVGWPGMVAADQTFRPALTLVDSGNWESTVVAFCTESGPGYLPTKGFGVQQLSRRKIAHDPGYEAVKMDAGHLLVEINSDYWKSWVHARIQTPTGELGGLTLFHASAQEHLSFAKHLTAEKRVEEFIAGRGLVSRWEAINRNNHFLDALGLASVAGHGAGERVVVAEPKPAPTAKTAPKREGSGWVDKGNWLGDRKGWLR